MKLNNISKSWNKIYFKCLSKFIFYIYSQIFYYASKIQIK